MFTSASWSTWLWDLLQVTSYVLLFVLVFLAAKALKDLTTSYRLDEEMTIKDNVALCLSVAGYLAATAIIFGAAVTGPSRGWGTDLLLVSAYSLVGIVLLNLSRFINDRWILFQFSNEKEIIEDRNSGTGAVQMGSYLASGMIVAGAMHGEGGGILTALVFFALGQAALVLFSRFYEWLTPFGVHDEIERDNVAAGVAFGGALAGLGLVMANAVVGDFVSWPENLARFAFNGLLGFFLLAASRSFLNRIIMPGADLDQEIQRDRNLGAGILEAVAAVSFSAILFAVL